MKKINGDTVQCPNFKKCGGCRLLNMSYEEQKKRKQVKVIRLLGRFHHVNEMIGMEKPFHYRCKVQAAFGEKNGQIISGVYQSSTHNIVCVDDCLLEDEKADAIIVTVRKLLKSFKLKPFNDTTMTGFLRHVLVRKGFGSGQIMVVLVTGSGEFKDSGKFVNALLERHPEITTIVRNINNGFTSLVLGNESQVLFGDGYIEDSLCGCRFRISPKAFYQVNPVQTEKLYGKALEFADMDGSQTVIDAYCGTGTIGIIAAAKAKKVIGVELNSDALNDAKVNATLNGIDNIEFFEDDAGRFMTRLAQDCESVDVVIMDPPRAGASLDFLKALSALSPQKIVYVSCSPDTLERDLNFLVRKGYKVRRIQPVDMFPWTEHIETVVLMSKAGKESK